ncbi:MAG: Bug family tripartite tricarboxylate transporter substrate binding protein [Acetobacteraceae bacterium]
MPSPTRRALLLAAALAPLAAPAVAQGWPSRPIRLIAPFPPGGGTDFIARLLADRIPARAGWTMVVENRPGAGGNIGLDAVAKAAPDGYTLGVGQTSNMAVNPALYPSMPFDPLADLTPIGTIAAQPNLLVVAADSPWRTVAELVAAARARPGDLVAANAGNGTVGHLAGELFARAAGIQLLHVPYRGAAPATADLLGGRAHLFFSNPLAVGALVTGGRLRPLAVTSAARARGLPEVPTLAEQGFAGFDVRLWTGLVGPARLPEAVVSAVNAALQGVLAEPETQARMASEGSEPFPGTPAEFAAFLRREHATWGRVVREAGIRLS